MYTLYGIPNCNTVKKARLWLEKNAVSYVFHDFRKQGITETDVAEWFKSIPWNKLLNKSSTTYKAMTTEEKNSIVDEHSAMKILLKSPTSIKRPVIVNENGKAISVGFSEDTFTSIFLLNELVNH